MTITFDEHSHTYTNEAGRTLSGVTTMLKDAGLSDAQWFDDAAALRGTRVHVATALFDRGTQFEFDNIPDECRPYFDAWLAFRKEVGVEIIEIELPVHSEVWSFAGTLDRIVRFHGGPLSLLEIKTGQWQPWHRIQTAGYRIAAIESYKPVFERWCVYLSADGKCRLDNHDNDEDLAVFRSLAVVNQWKENNR